MKKLLCLTVIFLFAGITAGTAQGILFEQGSWKEVLAKAKAQKKLIFVDVFTSWCGPCRKMAAEVFPLPEVGEKFNGDFVNYKIDAEKGEGVGIAKTYGVKAFPTYLFVNGDGKLVYRATGYNDAGKFLQHAIIAAREQLDPKPLAEWEKEYASGKRDKDFLEGYLKKLAIVDKPAAEVAEELFPMLTEEDLGNKELMSAILSFRMNNSCVPNGKVYNYVIKHAEQLDGVIGNGSLEKLRMGLSVYFRDNIIPDKKEKMLPVLIASLEEVKKMMGESDDQITAKEIRMNYYSGVHDESKLVPAVMDYVNNGLLKKDLDVLRQQDAIDYQKMREPFLSGQADSTKMANWELMNKLAANQRIMGYSYQIRTAAELVYFDVKDPQALQQAISWMQKASGYFDHFSHDAVYAALLAKTGKKQEAIVMMQKAAASTILASHEGIRNMLLDNVERIRAGKPLENLWHL
ncbi:thioredoxin family protein [Chitinophaga sp. XS-30]|uniref:thioredoxin family protein n=1 Tax=Chitinophaga sp. XS-30 TaxID=2604421 RepID=UPI0011DE1520|nr:thioredoxin family protein [Chitinophaga sp. XS-30]QEH41205.1 thioredoxin family protein [Chitinophaga sp. XS-30]